MSSAHPDAISIRLSESEGEDSPISELLGPFIVRRTSNSKDKGKGKADRKRAVASILATDWEGELVKVANKRARTLSRLRRLKAEADASSVDRDVPEDDRVESSRKIWFAKKGENSQAPSIPLSPGKHWEDEPYSPPPSPMATLEHTPERTLPPLSPRIPLTPGKNWHPYPFSAPSPVLDSALQLIPALPPPSLLPVQLASASPLLPKLLKLKNGAGRKDRRSKPYRGPLRRTIILTSVKDDVTGRVSPPPPPPSPPPPPPPRHPVIFHRALEPLPPLAPPLQLPRLLTAAVSQPPASPPRYKARASLLMPEWQVIGTSRFDSTSWAINFLAKDEIRSNQHKATIDAAVREFLVTRDLHTLLESLDRELGDLVGWVAASISDIRKQDLCKSDILCRKFRNAKQYRMVLLNNRVLLSSRFQKATGGLRDLKPEDLQDTMLLQEALNQLRDFRDLELTF